MATKKKKKKKRAQPQVLKALIFCTSFIAMALTAF
jgi:hypothetical protein